MEPGASLGPYCIDRELGSGGMGKVFAATVAGRVPGMDDGARVALKVVHPHLLETADAARRFRREVEIGRTVDHPNVVRTFGGGEADGQHYLAMEYVEGQTLDALLDELERVPEELCRHIGREVSKGLAAIHAVGAIHRDIKPENVLITPGHVVKIMDLGVARSMDDALRLSQTGAFVGSLHYAAPEQFRGGGRGLDGRCDLHALGLLLYELASGQAPYLADDIPEVVRKVLHEEPRRLGAANPQLSAFFEEVVHCLLAKDRDARFADAGALLAALQSGEESGWWRERSRVLQTTTKRPMRRIRIPRETAVHGREAELTRLRLLYDRAAAGEGQVVLLQGEAGIGKSRLVDELVGRLHRDGEDFNFLFGGYPPGGAATSVSGFSGAFRAHFGEQGCKDYLTRTPLLAASFDAFLRGEPAPGGAIELTGASLGTCFVQATSELAAERTTVVLIEDLHFSPEEARTLFAAIALAIPGRRVLLVGTMRPGGEEAWAADVARLEHASRLPLERIAPKDLIALLEDAFRSQSLSETLGAKIAVKSDGNPFFAFEIVRGLRERNQITLLESGSWVTSGVIEEIEIPSSVLDLVNARVSGLTEEERDLLDVACCWGFEFDPGLVGDVLGLRRIPLLKRFGQIERRHRLVRSSGRHYVFDHHQVQEALYGTLHEQMREEYHAALADALEARAGAADQDPAGLDGALCLDLCEQFLAGGRGPQTVRYLEAALGHLESGYRFARSVELSERALAVPGLLTGVGRARHLLRLARPRGTLNRIGMRSRQEAAAREALALAKEAGDEALEGLVANALGHSLSYTSLLDEAEASCRRALEIALSVGDSTAAANATGNLAHVFHSQGRLDDALEYNERARAQFRALGDRRGEAVGAGNVGVVLKALGRLPEARDHFAEHLALSREVGDRTGEARALANLGQVLRVEGRLREAREHLGRCLTVSREVGYRGGEVQANAYLGGVFHFEGALDEARRHYERATAISRELGDAQGVAAGLQNEADLLIEREEFGRAEELLVAALRSCAGVGYKATEASTTLMLGSLRAETGDREGAREAFAAARDMAAQCGDRSTEAVARIESELLPGGDVQGALTAFAECEDRLAVETRRSVHYELWRATGDRAHLSQAKRLLDESVANVEDETRAPMLTNLRLNRAIMAAWTEHGGGTARD